ncbi:GNAT family N-acetyltransferase [Granulicella sibirica]|uniref:Ribosomal-protein-S18p-alanine acetyltransferase n=1 Tax=Granulicella sibirica TaxID=2479048 RepID=A0A4Q0T4I6_9BACT|nr:GNAT family N-acetyltransferase [Granulicella sibirica]RXH56476.1 Ribosomal-protein-S18p-alanine acetyltransferase [Granulicella sibirica]
MFLMDQRCFDRRFRFSLHSMRDFAEGDFSVSVVAEIDGAMVGFAIAEVEGGTAYLITLDVDPDRRRLGIARRMLRWLEEQGGAEIWELHVFAENLEAVRFYESCGFELVGLVPGFYGAGMDGLAYRRVVVG